MKIKLLILSIIVTAFSFQTNAQNVIFSNDFESFADNSGAVALGMQVWEGTARCYVYNSPAYVTFAPMAQPNGESTKFVLCNPNNANLTNGKSYYFRKEGIAVIPGITYVFEVKTYGNGGKDHKIGLNYGVKANYITAQDTAELATAKMSNVPFTETEWTTRTLEFTPSEYQSNYPLNIFVFVYGTGQVYVDDFKLYEKPESSGVKNNSVNNFKVTKTYTSGVYQIRGAGEVQNYVLLDMKGSLVKSSQNENRIVDMTANPKGVYLLKITDVEGITETHKLINN